MGKFSSLEEEVMGHAEPICAAHGVELVEVRALTGRKATTFRVTIDRERPESDPTPGSGIMLSACQNVSRDLSTALDVHGEVFATLNYHLEVSSPGLERPLVRMRDFTKFAGREAKIKTFGPIDGRKLFTGRLIGVSGDDVQVEVDGTTVSIDFAQIAKANLVHRFER